MHVHMLIVVSSLSLCKLAIESHYLNVSRSLLKLSQINKKNSLNDLTLNTTSQTLHYFFFLKFVEVNNKTFNPSKILQECLGNKHQYS
jgi:hypothetical protein